MKKYILSLIVMFAASATVTMAQDDMYFVPKKETKEEKAARKAMEDSIKAVEKARHELAEKIAFEKQQREYEDMMVRLYRRIYHEDVDAYNRHYAYNPNDTLVFDSLNTGDDRFTFSNVEDTLYNVNDNYKYLKMISRFDDLDIRYYPYDDYYPWNDPWYYYPSHYWGWNYGYRHFYNPFSPYWRYGYYDPFYYGRDPWWYTWYDPFFDGFYGWGWHYGWGYRPYYDVYYVHDYGYIGHHGSIGTHHGHANTNLPVMAGTTNHGGWNPSSRNHNYSYGGGSSSSSYGSSYGTSTPRNSYWGNSSSSRISTSSSSNSSSSSRSYSTPSTSHSSGFSGGSRSSGGGGGFSGGGHGGGSRSTGGRH